MPYLGVRAKPGVSWFRQASAVLRAVQHMVERLAKFSDTAKAMLATYGAAITRVGKLHGYQRVVVFVEEISFSNVGGCEDA
ncbi:hypothetical protein FOZ61_006381 [Perkinsus olseni]|uniref:Uncharacterized protein n=1 Tax=Perkinsus olseni TaxID=32597 RepID=A0A7J6LDF6_PEROL|nr:hypothetical protein FOZ61_006381 [Perkinsus olseni]